VYNIYDNTIHS